MWKRRKSKKRPFGKLVKIFLIIFIPLGLLLVIIFFGPKLFLISKIEVDAKEIKCASGDQIKEVSGTSRKNFFLIDSSKIESNLKKKFFCIKSVATSKYFPEKIHLQVLGRQPFAKLLILETRGASASSLIENISTPSAKEVRDTYVLDREGVVFEKETESLDLPKIYTPDLSVSLGTKFSESAVNSLKVLDKIKGFGLQVQQNWMDKEILIINSDALRPKVIFNLNGNTDIQLASLQLILDKAKIDLKELEFIDLRYDKPIVKFVPKK